MFTLKQIIEVLNKEDKQLHDLEYLLREYDNNDWLEYVNFDDKTYKRNLIFKNSKYEILLICWKPGQLSKIHDQKWVVFSKCLKGNYQNLSTIKIYNLSNQLI